VIVYETIALPPSAGAVHVTAARASPALAATAVGADGVVGPCGGTRFTVIVLATLSLAWRVSATINSAL
jgi:hypothetical protein